MKKSLLLVLAVWIGFTIIAQNHALKKQKNTELDFIEGSATFQPLETYIGSIKSILTSINEEKISDDVTFEINPNPLRGKALMKYSIPSDGQISIELLSIDSRVISNLINDSKPAGEGAIEFNSDGLNPGSYLVKFNFKGTIEKTIIRKLFIY